MPRLIICLLYDFLFQLAFMRGTWSFDQFSLAEANAIYNGITNFISNEGNLEE